MHSRNGHDLASFRRVPACGRAAELLCKAVRIRITPWSPKWISPRPLRRDPPSFRKLSMTALVILDSISLTTPDGRPLFDGLTLALGRERTGIVGRNGCGKSTLLRLIAGEAEPAGGSVHRAGSIGMLAQLADERLSVAQALGVSDGLARLRRLERGDGSLEDSDGGRLDAARPHRGSAGRDRPARIAAGSSGRLAERRRADARRAGTIADRGPRSAAARRAHQQSRRRRPRGGGAVAGALAGRLRGREPRPRACWSASTASSS